MTHTIADVKKTTLTMLRRMKRLRGIILDADESGGILEVATTAPGEIRILIDLLEDAADALEDYATQDALQQRKAMRQKGGRA